MAGRVRAAARRRRSRGDPAARPSTATSVITAERRGRDRQQPLGVGDPAVVVVLLGVHQQRDQHAGQHAAEQQLVDHVGQVVGDVVGVADRRRCRARRRSRMLRRKPVIRLARLATAIVRLSASSPRRCVRSTVGGRAVGAPRRSGVRRRPRRPTAPAGAVGRAPSGRSLRARSAAAVAGDGARWRRGRSPRRRRGRPT